METVNTENNTNTPETDKYSKFTCFFSMIIAICSVMTFVVILIVALMVVPKTLSLMNTAQRTLSNLETVSEELKSLELTDKINSIEENTANAMQDVSASMKRLMELDLDSLNQSINDLSESVSEFRNLFK